MVRVLIGESIYGVGALPVALVRNQPAAASCQEQKSVRYMMVSLQASTGATAAVDGIQPEPSILATIHCRSLFLSTRAFLASQLIKVYTVYQHMANDDTRESYVAQGLAVGQTVRQNDVIGRQGNWRYYPENAPVTHLHFEVAYKPDTYTLPDRITVDPMPYLIGGGQSACSGAPINSGAPPALKILRPSRANPVDVGTPANPSKFTIEIAYAGSASLQDVTVTVGGKPATIINMTPTRYAMEIRASADWKRSI